MKKLSILILLLLPVLAFGQKFEKAVVSAEADLLDAVERLSGLREEIKNEKIPLSKELREQETQLREKRREVERIHRIQDNVTVDLNALEKRVSARKDEVHYLGNLLSEFGNSFRSRVDKSEVQEFADFFQSLENLESNPDIAKMDKLIDQMKVVEASLSRVDRQIGGMAFEGSAIAEGGVSHDGHFIAMGPLYYFSSNDGNIAGLSQNIGSLEPKVFSFSPAQNEMVHEIAKTQKGTLPLDATLGDAIAIAETKESLGEHIQKGGIWIYPILGFAAIAFLVAVFKMFEIYSVKMPEPGSLHSILRLLEDGKKEEALAFAKNVKGPAGRMLIDAVNHSDEGKELVEEVLYERMLEVQPKLERMLPFIQVTAATAPLMGLLGTVTGMINTFKLITIFGTGDAKSLSSGISEALVTTEFGLIVAIPALILHSLLARRSGSVMASLEHVAVAFVNGLNSLTDNKNR